jgi:hypothetical protein
VEEKEVKQPIPRAYVYDPDYVMISSEDVEEHANIAITRLKDSGIEKPDEYVRLREFFRISTYKSSQV